MHRAAYLRNLAHRRSLSFRRVYVRATSRVITRASISTGPQFAAEAGWWTPRAPASRSPPPSRAGATPADTCRAHCQLYGTDCFRLCQGLGTWGIPPRAHSSRHGRRPRATAARRSTTTTSLGHRRGAATYGPTRHSVIIRSCMTTRALACATAHSPCAAPPQGSSHKRCRRSNCRRTSRPLKRESSRWLGCTLLACAMIITVPDTARPQAPLHATTRSIRRTQFRRS